VLVRVLLAVANADEKVFGVEPRGLVVEHLRYALGSAGGGGLAALGMEVERLKRREI
jgi:hypothetical protein